MLPEIKHNLHSNDLKFSRNDLGVFTNLYGFASTPNSTANLNRDVWNKES